MGYLDFDISVTLSDEGACRIAVLRSPAGEVAATTSRAIAVEPVVEAVRRLAADPWASLPPRANG